MRDSPCAPRLRSVSSYSNIRAVTTARSLNKSLQNLSLTEECERRGPGTGGGVVGGDVHRGIRCCHFSAIDVWPAPKVLQTHGSEPVPCLGRPQPGLLGRAWPRGCQSCC